MMYSLSLGKVQPLHSARCNATKADYLCHPAMPMLSVDQVHESMGSHEGLSIPTDLHRLTSFLLAALALIGLRRWKIRGSPWLYPTNSYPVARQPSVIHYASSAASSSQTRIGDRQDTGSIQIWNRVVATKKNGNLKRVKLQRDHIWHDTAPEPAISLPQPLHRRGVFSGGYVSVARMWSQVYLTD